MSEFLAKINEQEETYGEIVRIVSNFKKEPKRSLKRTERVLQWLDKINQLWDVFKQRNNELN